MVISSMQPIDTTDKYFEGKNPLPSREISEETASRAGTFNSLTSSTISSKKEASKYPPSKQKSSNGIGYSEIVSEERKEFSSDYKKKDSAIYKLLHKQLKSLTENKTDKCCLQKMAIGAPEMEAVKNGLLKYKNFCYLSLSTLFTHSLDFCKIDVEGAKILGEGLPAALSLKALYLGTCTARAIGSNVVSSM